MTSSRDRRSGIQFSRTIRCFAHTSRISIAATMKNIKTDPIGAVDLIGTAIAL